MKFLKFWIKMEICLKIYGLYKKGFYILREICGFSLVLRSCISFLKTLDIYKVNNPLLLFVTYSLPILTFG